MQLYGFGFSGGGTGGGGGGVTSVNGDAGPAVTLDTDDVGEGATNLYYTNARADARITAADTDDLSEGVTNLYFTNTRADGRIGAALLNALSDVSYTPGAPIDDYVLTFDHLSSTWGAEAAGGGGGATRPTVTTPTGGVFPYAIAAPTGATELEHIYLIDNAAVAVEVDLPTAAGIGGFKLQIKRLGTATVSIDPNLSEQIDNGGAGVVFDLISQYASVTLVSNGTNWLII